MKNRLRVMLSLFVANLLTPYQCWQTPQTPMLLGYENIQLSLKILSHLSRLACGCLLPASPLNADRLSDVKPLQLLLEVEASGWSLTSVAAISSPRSKSVSRGIGIAAEGESLAVSAACAWTSSMLSWYGACAVDVVVLEEGFVIDRTTSPLQIGHVRRRVVSQGVLAISQYAIRQVNTHRQLTCTRREIHGHTVGSSLCFPHPHTPQDRLHTRLVCHCISCGA